MGRHFWRTSIWRQLGLILTLLCTSMAAQASELTCPTDAHGPARTPGLILPSEQGPAYGTMQYRLGAAGFAPKQIALTFDDGPDPETTPRVLAILDQHCIKATFFLVGLYAEKHPDLVRLIAAHGHTIGTHSFTHPNLRHLSFAAATREITRGFSAAETALAIAPPGDQARLAPFFRFPGLNDKTSLRGWLGERNIATVSCDFGADDWKRINANQVYARALKNIDLIGRGILILHDTKPHTADMLSRLIVTLRARGYTFVQLLPTPEARTRAAEVPGALLHEVPILAQGETSTAVDASSPSLEPTHPLR